MAVQAVHSPKVIALLQKKDAKWTIKKLAKEVGCSEQTVYKVITKLGTQAKMVGTDAETGGYLYTFDPNGTLAAPKPKTASKAKVAVKATTRTTAPSPRAVAKMNGSGKALGLDDVLVVQSIQRTTSGVEYVLTHLADGREVRVAVPN